MAESRLSKRLREEREQKRKKRDLKNKKNKETKINPGGKGISNTRLTDNKQSRAAALKIKKGLGNAWNASKKFVGDTVGSINEQQARDKARRKREGIGEFATRDGNTYKANPGSKGIPNTTSGKPKTPKDTGGTSDADMKGWLEKTKNSPAGKAFGDSKEWNTKRWNLQKNKRLKAAAKQAAKLKKLAEAERLRKLALQQQKLQIKK